MTEQELVKRCLNAICRKNGFDDPSAMTQRDFELISHEVEDSTGILISVSTFKRLLHGRFSRMPQIATLNAISTYLGFKNWQDYRNSANKTGNSLKPAKEKNEKALNKGNSGYAFSFNWKLIGAVAITTAIVVFLSFVKISSRPAPGYEKAQFAAKKTTDNSIPNTVIFNYNIDDVNADSFFIQQSWDKRRRVKIFKHSYTLTDIYYEPGYHNAKLIANDSVIKTADVSIPTDKWFFCAKDKSLSGIPEYIKTGIIAKNGCLTLNKSDLASSNIKTEDEKTFMYTYFPGKIEVSSDNFTFKARVRMKEVRNNQCPYIMYEVFCQRRFMYFRSLPKGCASEAYAQFGDKFLYGKEVDLSSLCYDLNQWIDIELMVKNKVATVNFNNKQIFSAMYNNSSGLVTGLGFISNGLCEVDFVELKGLDGKVVYENDFNGSDSKTKTLN